MYDFCSYNLQKYFFRLRSENMESFDLLTAAAVALWSADMVGAGKPC